MINLLDEIEGRSLGTVHISRELLVELLIEDFERFDKYTVSHTDVLPEDFFAIETPNKDTWGLPAIQMYKVERTTPE